MPAKVIDVALIGGGMFGGDVVLRSIEDFERCGIAPYLGRVGLDHRARDLAAVRYRLVAVGTRTQASAERLCARYRERVPGAAPRPFHGDKPWEEIFRRCEVHLACVATPDPLHAEPTLCALSHGAHVLVEKPLALRLEEANAIVALSRDKGLIVGVDMHKRYDPCHRLIFSELAPRLGKLLYGRAVLEEPLSVATDVFQWAAASNPFSYVGVHWVDLFAHYLSVEPVSLHAVGQKELLASWDREGGTRKIDTFDALQVAIDYDSGLRVYYVNNWINPREFEGPVNQEMELVGTRGKVEFDQQYRGLRATITGVGSRTFNPHFARDVPRDGTSSPGALDGYGKDSITVIVERATEVLLGMAAREELAGSYPDVESSRSSVAVIEAAARVAELNWRYLQSGRGAPVTARFDARGYEVVDPLATQ